MEKIKELIVVEGKHDKARIEKLFSCNIICTNGLGIDEATLSIIKRASEKQGVIIFTDPDYPGKVIRDKIHEVAPQAKHVFVEKKDAIGKRNVGVEYLSDEKIVELLSNIITFEPNATSLTWQEYLNLGLISNKEKRDYLTSYLKLGNCNNKRLFKYLNYLTYQYAELKELLEKYQ